MSLESQAQSLKEYLNEELAIYRELLVLSKKKQKLLLERFSTDLMLIVNEEEKLIRRIAEIEESRLKCIEMFTGNAQSTMDEAIEKIADTKIKSDVWVIATDLKDVIGQIKDINLHNQKLLEQALELTQYSLSIITAPPREVTYRAPGKNKPTLPRSPTLIDRKA